MPSPVPQVLIDRIFEKAELVRQEDPRHAEIRTCLLILSGGMRGAGGSGCAVALHDLGLDNAFDVVIGISTGAPIASYFLAGGDYVALGASIYYRELAGANFIRFWPQPCADIDYLEIVFRSGKKRLPEKLVRDHRAKLVIGVTEERNGAGMLVDAREVHDLVGLIKASIAIPGLYVYARRNGYQPRLAPSLNGHRCLDGGVADPFPVCRAVKRFAPTDLLIIANRPESAMHGDRRPWLEKMCTPWVLRDAPRHIRELALMRRGWYRDGLNFLAEQPINWGALYAPDDGVHLMTRSASKLRAHAEASARQTFAVFGQPDREPSLL